MTQNIALVDCFTRNYILPLAHGPNLIRVHSTMNTVDSSMTVQCGRVMFRETQSAGIDISISALPVLQS